MVMGWIYTAMTGISILCALLSGRGDALAGAVLQGAQKGITLAVAMAGGLCLWSGLGNVMEAAGITRLLTRLLMPLLRRIFPDVKQDPQLAGDLSANLCANFLGLGNAATPMGIRAAKRLRRGETATAQLCRLIVLNSASIQLIPSTVAAVRSALGCSRPFDILLPVWISSFASAALGLLATRYLETVWR